MKNSASQIVLLFVGATLLSNILLVFFGGWSSGISVDEPTHVSRLASFFNHGWYLPYNQLAYGVPAAEIADAYVYGPVAALLVHLVAVLLGAEQFGHPSFHSEAYAARHVGTAFLSVVGLVATGSVARLIIGSWTWGLLAAAVLSSIPLWTGHGMFNIKDIPVATGYTLWTLGLILIYRNVKDPGASIIVLGLALIIAGLVLAVGTRPGMWAFAVTSFLVAHLAFYFLHSQRIGLVSRYVWLGRLLLVSAGFVFSYVLLWVIYPNAFSSPFSLIPESIQGSAHYNVWSGGWLSAGFYHDQPPPLWYFPAWLTHQMPVIILIFLVVGSGAAVVNLGKELFASDKTENDRSNLVSTALLMQQAYFGPLVAIILGSVVYSGTRQFLFFYPAAAVLATIGIYTVFRSIKKTRDRSKIDNTLLFLVALTLLLPTIDQWRLFPYSYAYFNELARLSTIDNRWPTDYWRTSHRELISRAEADVVIDCRGIPPEPVRDVVFRGHPREWHRVFPVEFWSGDGCGSPSGNPYIVERILDSSGTERGVERLEEFYLVGVNRHGVSIPKNCAMEHVEKRSLLGREMTMGWLARCHVYLPDAFEKFNQELAIAELASSGVSLLGGWSHLEPWGIWTNGSVAGIGLRNEGGAGMYEVGFRMHGYVVTEDPVRNVRIKVNNRPLGEIQLWDKEPKYILFKFEMEKDQEYIIFRFEIENPVSPSELNRGDDPRILGIGLSGVTLSRSMIQK